MLPGNERFNFLTIREEIFSSKSSFMCFDQSFCVFFPVCCKLNSGKDILVRNWRETFNGLLKSHFACQPIQNVTHSYSRAFNAGFSKPYFRIYADPVLPVLHDFEKFGFYKHAKLIPGMGCHLSTIADKCANRWPNRITG